MAGSRGRGAVELIPVASLKVGVMAIQGDFEAHVKVLRALDAEPVEVRTVAELEAVDALVMPGGESTTTLKGLADYGLTAPLRDRAIRGMPIFATCAGTIVLARAYLGVLDVSVSRNAYGRQVHSFEAELEFDGVLAAATETFTGVFIRAPWIDETGQGVEILGEHDGRPVAVVQDSILACTFHPELTDDPRFHALFLKMVRAVRAVRAVTEESSPATEAGR